MTTTIIAQNVAFIKWSEKKKLNIVVSNKMDAAGFEERAARMRFCGTFLNMKVCPDCGKSFISSANLCRDRLCPTCSWRLSLKRFAEMCQTMQYITADDYQKAGFLTLTVKNCKPEDLRHTIEKMSSDWHDLTLSRKFRAKVVGWARSLEITYNKRDNTFHPHFHIILLFKELESSNTTQVFFRKEWNRVAKLDYEAITDYREIFADENTEGTEEAKIEKALIETYKYSVKSEELADMPLSSFRALTAGIAGIRFYAFGGIIKKARQYFKFTDKDNETELDCNREICDCGALLTDELMKWSFQDEQYKPISEYYN